MATPEKVKNVVLVGQGGVGKTMLAEAMLHLTGTTTRLGGHAGTKPTLDYDAEEGERGFSISTTIAPVSWEDTRINVLDAPCYPDFIGDAYTAMSACETAAFVVDAAAGPGTVTTRLWFAAEELSLARALFINRLDRPDADFDAAMASLREHFGTNIAAVTIPMGVGSAFAGIIDVVRMEARHLEGGKPVTSEIPAEFLDAAQSAREALTELVVEADDELMMKYLDGQEITTAEIEGLLSKAMIERVFVPVFAGSCVKEEGIISFMNAVTTWFPAMADFGRVPLVNGEELDISPDDDRPVAFVFKSLNDPQNGRLSFIKVLAGTLTPGVELNNARTRKGERLGHLYRMTGRETADVKKVAAGDICVVPKLDGPPPSASPTRSTALPSNPTGAATRESSTPSSRRVQMQTRRSASSATRIRARLSCPRLARRRSASCLTALRTAWVLRRTLSNCASPIARPFVASRAPRVATRNRPAARASSVTAGCALSPTRTAATSSSTKSSAVISPAASSPQSTRAFRRPCATACWPATR